MNRADAQRAKEYVEYLRTLPSDKLEFYAELLQNGGFHAYDDCHRGKCGYPKVYFGQCFAIYWDTILASMLKEEGVLLKHQDDCCGVA